jgi:hypothetical protein
LRYQRREAHNLFPTDNYVEILLFLVFGPEQEKFLGAAYDRAKLPGETGVTFQKCSRI